MRVYLPLKTGLLSALHFLLAIIVSYIVDVVIAWLFNKVAFHVINWFNTINIVWQILLFAIVVWIFFAYLLSFLLKVIAATGGLIFDRLPHNLFTTFSATVLCIANIIFCIVRLWRSPQGYSFWIVCELIFLSVFIWLLGVIVLPAKEQLQIFRRRSY